MLRISSAVLAVALISTMAGCSSKVATRVDTVEARMGEYQRVTQERLENEGRQMATLNQRIEEMSTRLAAIDREVRAQEAGIKQVSEYLERYDATWSTFARLQSDYDNELQKLRDQQLAAATSLAESRREIDAGIRTLSSDLLTARNDLRQRVDRTNDDVFRLREQSKEKLDDMTSALKTFGDALQEILTLQRAQFQSMTDAYSRSLSDIEPYLPEAMLSNLNTPELLVSPNPDVRAPARQDSEQPQ